jgi:tRNA threonylcarbamoyladenosine modification (KEOPS) complex Cgi121 subunit
MTYELAGARGHVSDPQAVVPRAQAWAAEHRAEVLLADASVVFGRDHLESAVRHALRARALGAGVARDLGLETLRYLCAKRQVSEAIRTGGIQPGTEAVAVVVFESSADDLLTHLGWTRDDAVLGPEGKSLRVLGVTRIDERSLPRERVADLALERTALLDLDK